MFLSNDWPNLSIWLILLGQHVYCNYLLSRLWCHFEINLSFTIKSFSYMTKNFRRKMKISWEWKELLTWNKKHFSSLLKSFHLTEKWTFTKWTFTRIFSCCEFISTITISLFLCIYTENILDFYIVPGKSFLWTRKSMVLKFDWICIME